MEIGKNPCIYQNRNLINQRQNNPSFGVKIDVEGLSSRIHNAIKDGTPLTRDIDLKHPGAAIVELPGKWYERFSTTAIDLCARAANKLPKEKRYIKLGKTEPQIESTLNKYSTTEEALMAQEKIVKPKRTIGSYFKKIIDRMLFSD